MTEREIGMIVAAIWLAAFVILSIRILTKKNC